MWPWTTLQSLFSSRAWDMLWLCSNNNLMSLRWCQKWSKSHRLHVISSIIIEKLYLAFQIFGKWLPVKWHTLIQSCMEFVKKTVLNSRYCTTCSGVFVGLRSEQPNLGFSWGDALNTQVHKAHFWTLPCCCRWCHFGPIKDPIQPCMKYIQSNHPQGLPAPNFKNCLLLQ